MIFIETSTKRPEFKNKKELKDHPFFEGIDWGKVLKKEYDPPFIDKDDENYDEIPIPKRVFLKKLLFFWFFFCFNLADFQGFWLWRR